MNTHYNKVTQVEAVEHAENPVYGLLTDIEGSIFSCLHLLDHGEFENVEDCIEQSAASLTALLVMVRRMRCDAPRSVAQLYVEVARSARGADYASQVAQLLPPTMTDAERGALRLEQMKDGHHGSLTEWLRDRDLRQAAQIMNGEKDDTT